MRGIVFFFPQRRGTPRHVVIPKRAVKVRLIAKLHTDNLLDLGKGQGDDRRVTKMEKARQLVV